MNHADWAKYEANTIELTKCGICGVHSYATIANGWDEVTDHETGETFEICGGCSNDFADAPELLTIVED